MRSRLSYAFCVSPFVAKTTQRVSVHAGLVLPQTCHSKHLLLRQKQGSAVQAQVTEGSLVAVLHVSFQGSCCKIENGGKSRVTMSTPKIQTNTSLALPPPPSLILLLPLPRHHFRYTHTAATIITIRTATITTTTQTSSKIERIVHDQNNRNSNKKY